MKKYFPDMPLVAYPNTGEKWQRSNRNINTDKLVQNSKSEKESSNMLFFNFFINELHLFDKDFPIEPRKAASEVTSENWVGNFGSWSGNPENIITHVESWLEMGYSWIGGCCRVTPDDISQIRKIFDEKFPNQAMEMKN